MKIVRWNRSRLTQAARKASGLERALLALWMEISSSLQLEMDAGVVSVTLGFGKRSGSLWLPARRLPRPAEPAATAAHSNGTAQPGPLPTSSS